MIDENTKLKDLAGSLDISGIKPEFLNKTFGELGHLTWGEVDPSGRLMASFERQKSFVEMLASSQE